MYFCLLLIMLPLVVHTPYRRTVRDNVYMLRLGIVLHTVTKKAVSFALLQLVKMSNFISTLLIISGR